MTHSPASTSTCYGAGSSSCSASDASTSFARVETLSGSVGSVASLTGLDTSKAGLQTVDKERVNQIIEAASRNSRFHEHERRRERQIAAQLARLTEKREQLTPEDFAVADVEVAEQMALIESKRHVTTATIDTCNRTSTCTGPQTETETDWVVHVDMDAFYAQVEMRDNPALRGVPVAVGGESMLSTSNYLARQFGVRAAMPGFIARKLCPHLTIVPCNFLKYREASECVSEVLREYDPHLRMVSLDEGYLSLAGHVTERRAHSHTSTRTYTILQEDSTLKEESFGSSIEEIVLEMRKRVYTKARLTCSAGIAANCLLAKIASDVNKPNGQFLIPLEREKITSYMRDLPVRKIGGIGKVTERLLNGLGIHTCGDMYDMRCTLYLLFSHSSFQYFLRASLGIGHIPDFERDSANQEARKSLSSEKTFRPIGDKQGLCEILRELSEEVCKELKKHCLVAKNVTIKIKLTSFEVNTRCVTLQNFTNASDVVYEEATKLLNAYLQSEGPGQLIRLMGVRVAKLENTDKKRLEAVTIKKWFSKDSNNSGNPTESKPCSSKDVDTVQSDKLFGNVNNAEIPAFIMPDIVEESSNDFEFATEAVPGKIVSERGVIQNAEVEVDENVLVSEPIFCPIFNCVIGPKEDINRHVDECLSRMQVRALVRESNTVGSSKTTAGARPILKTRKQQQLARPNGNQVGSGKRKKTTQAPIGRNGDGDKRVKFKSVDVNFF